MNLLRIGALDWSVFVTLDVLLFLNDWGRAKQPKASMTSLLVNSVPSGGPQENNPTICKPLQGSDGLFYFRKGKRSGEKVRVFWFYGDTAGRHVVCVWGCVKTQRFLKQEDINIAESAHHAYRLDAARINGIKIEDGIPLLRRKT